MSCFEKNCGPYFSCELVRATKACVDRKSCYSKNRIKRLRSYSQPTYDVLCHRAKTFDLILWIKGLRSTEGLSSFLSHIKAIYDLLPFPLKMRICKKMQYFFLVRLLSMIANEIMLQKKTIFMSRNMHYLPT